MIFELEICQNLSILGKREEEEEEEEKKVTYRVSLRELKRTGFIFNTRASGLEEHTGSRDPAYSDYLLIEPSLARLEI